MAQLTRNLLNGVRTVLGSSPEGEDAWIDNDAPLTPREHMIRQTGRVLQLGALLNGAILLLMLLLLAFNIFAADAASNLLLGGIEAGAGVAVTFGILGIAANVSLLLLLAIGALAQETWTLVLTVATAIINVAVLIAFGFWPALVMLPFLGYILFVWWQDRGAFHSNAVMNKELRGRMRGVRAFAIITVFLLLMGSFTVLLYLLELPRISSGDAIVTGELGRLLFIGVAGIELLLIIFIVPALTSGAVTGERERKTYDLLQTTLLSAPSFIVGKMESALGYMILLLLSAIPLQSIAFLFGGVSSTEVLLAFVLLAVTALLLGGLGMYFSATTDRTMTSTVRVYIGALLLVGLPHMLSFFLFRHKFAETIIGVGSPVGGDPFRETLTIYADMFLVALSPITSGFETRQMLFFNQELGVLQAQLASDGSAIPIVSPWILTTIIYVGLTAVLLLLAVRRMRKQ